MLAAGVLSPRPAPSKLDPYLRSVQLFLNKKGAGLYLTYLPDVVGVTASASTSQAVVYLLSVPTMRQFTCFSADLR